MRLYVRNITSVIYRREGDRATGARQGATPSLPLPPYCKTASQAAASAHPTVLGNTAQYVGRVLPAHQTCSSNDRWTRACFAAPTGAEHCRVPRLLALEALYPECVSSPRRHNAVQDGTVGTTAVLGRAETAPGQFDRRVRGDGVFKALQGQGRTPAPMM
jgi:hypothetical protein